MTRVGFQSLQIEILSLASLTTFVQQLRIIPQREAAARIEDQDPLHQGDDLEHQRVRHRVRIHDLIVRSLRQLLASHLALQGMSAMFHISKIRGVGIQGFFVVPHRPFIVECSRLVLNLGAQPFQKIALCQRAVDDSHVLHCRSELLKISRIKRFLLIPGLGITKD